MSIASSMVYLFFLLLACVPKEAFSQLRDSFYDLSCPSLLTTATDVLRKASDKEPRIGASLLRLHFHDCFVNGCDGSILLDDTAGVTGEKTALPNNRSARGFDVVDDVKAAVERSCRGVVSCADILAILAHQSVVLMGGPTWTVRLGRRDSIIANLSGANSDLPPPTSTVSNLISKFQAKGLTVQDLVALSGAHTLGQSRCFQFRDRLYNFSNTGKPDPVIRPAYLASLQKKCPRSSGDDILSPLDVETPTDFDNSYFQILESDRAVLNSDSVLTSSSSTQKLVTTYSDNQAIFFRDFANAMVKMGNISPLTGSAGQIRRNCRRVNPSQH